MRIWFLLLLLSLPASAQPPSSTEPGSGRPHPVHALTNARVIVSPGRMLERSTLVIRDGKVEGVGVPVPPEARVWDMSGKTIHAGFIDPYVTVGRMLGKPMREKKKSEEEEEKKEEEPLVQSQVSSANPNVHPEWRVVDHLKPKKEVVEKLRALGFVAVQAVPDHGVARGTAGVYLLEKELRPSVLVPESALAFGFVRPTWTEDRKPRPYPVSMMGNVALLRQLFLDAAWYHTARAADAAVYQGAERPLVDASLEALNRELPALVEAETLLEVLRMHALLDGAGRSRRITMLSGEEWRRLDWVQPLSGGWIVPVYFPAKPAAETEGEWNSLSLLDLTRWRNGPANPRWLAESGLDFALTTHRLDQFEDFERGLALALGAGLSKDRALAALTTEPAALLGLSDRLGTLEPGRSASFVVRSGDPFDSEVEEVWIEGRRYPDYTGLGKKEEGEKEPAGHPFSADELKRPEVPAPPPSETVLVRGATVWTPDGPRAGNDLLASGGKIVAVGPGLSTSGATVIDGRGRHVTAGLIDAHSHAAIDGGVNESTDSVTSEVRIADVLDPFDWNIYWQLAGGVTAANVMHGSANTIGGQVATCRWRWGVSPSELVMEGATPGIKFALGENVKQSNWGDAFKTRYPQTRMGVAEVIREAFGRARDYRREQTGRRDLRLEALLEILDGRRIIHCHSYRQDEILALLQVADSEGFKVSVFQHVLEGYKVADEMAAHGAAASTFADWWAYKYEVLDAVPYNATLMHRRGVKVSVNSDDRDLARRLNTEAAKSVRYGGLSEREALDLVTLNPARQLGIDHLVGSLQPGKEADFVLWSDHPLSQRAVCLATWVQGRRYFDREQDAQMQQDLRGRWAALVERAMK